MPPRILPILNRLRQDQSAHLAPEAIEHACRQEGYTWRKRLLDPVMTIYLFLLQILHGNTACQHVVQFGCWTFTDSAYCQARKRLPLRVYHRLLERTSEAARLPPRVGVEVEVRAAARTTRRVARAAR